VEAIQIKVTYPQEGMSEFRKRGWFPLFAGEAEQIAREGQCERRRVRGEGWRKRKRKPFEGGRSWMLIAGTLFHFEKIEAPTTVTVAHAVAAGPVCQAVSLSQMRVEHAISKSAP
jgi:hypothetical protein